MPFGSLAGKNRDWSLPTSEKSPNILGIVKMGGDNKIAEWMWRLSLYEWQKKIENDWMAIADMAQVQGVLSDTPPTPFRSTIFHTPFLDFVLTWIPFRARLPSTNAYHLDILFAVRREIWIQTSNGSRTLISSRFASLAFVGYLFFCLLKQLTLSLANASEGKSNLVCVVFFSLTLLWGNNITISCHQFKIIFKTFVLTFVCFENHTKI